MKVVVRLAKEYYGLGGRRVPIGSITVTEPTPEFIATCDPVEFHKKYVEPKYGTNYKRDSFVIMKEIYIKLCWNDRPFTLDTKLYLFNYLLDQKDEENIERFIAGFEWNRLWNKEYKEFAILFCHRIPRDMALCVYTNSNDPEVKLLYKLYWGFE